MVSQCDLRNELTALMVLARSLKTIDQTLCTGKGPARLP